MSDNRNLNQAGMQGTVLFVDYTVPIYDKYAGSRTNFMYLRLLKKLGLSVKFLPADFQHIEPYTSELNKLGIETLDGQNFQANHESWFEARGHELDFVYFNKPDPTIKFFNLVKRCTKAAIIYQCHDLHYLRIRRKAEVDQDANVMEESYHYEKMENYILENSDVILTYSSFEDSLIRKKFPHKKVFTVPIFFYESIAQRKVPFEETRDLLFVGSCNHTPNYDAIKWFCLDILPLVKQAIPDLCVNIVGTKPPVDIQKLASNDVKILDHVNDVELQKLYEEVRLAIIPLRFGAGVKGKTIEALYHGVPFVSTSIGLEGIQDINTITKPRDKPVDFTNELVSLYSNKRKWENFVQRGTSLIKNNLTFEKTADQIAHILKIAKEEQSTRKVPAEPPRLIAFYLPQYHPIAENDEWWGKGFTEWRNVAKAKPLFPKHYQPHLPADLGFYDLRAPETRMAQAAMARKYGIYGFCYYHYWFNGKCLLDLPAEEMLSSKNPDFPFCLCWANENWTRRWDGEDQHVLIEQKYSEADDRQHIRDLFRFFRDERYIRIDGKPMFLVYRTENMPDPAQAARIWRNEAIKNGIGELYLVRVESIGKCDPTSIHFDAAVEFAPDWWNKGLRLNDYQGPVDKSNGEVEDYNQIYANNYIHTYDQLVETMLAKPIPDYKFMRCVTPSWDNTARRQKGAHVFLGSTPQKYQDWLKRTIEWTQERMAGDENLVFVNAWNEWAEGNHLEPDQEFKRGYLEATFAALQPTNPPFIIPNEETEQNCKESDDRPRAAAAFGETANQNFCDLYSQINNQKEMIHALESQIEEIYKSRSWSVTAPIRWIFQRIYRIKQRLSNFG